MLFVRRYDMVIRKNTIIFSLLLLGILSFTFSTQAFAAWTTLYPTPKEVEGSELILNPPSSLVEADDLSLNLQLVAAEDVVERRLAHLEISQPYQVLVHEDKLIVSLPERANTPYVNSVIAHVGKIEFVDGGMDSLRVGEKIKTGAKPNSAQGLYQTLFTGQDVAEIVSPDAAAGQLFHQLTLEAEAAQRVSAFMDSHAGNHVCIVLDQEVVSCSTMYHWLENTLEILPNLNSNSVVSLADLAIFLDSGPLPVPLQIQR